jgi:hypothetical protein
VRAGTHCLTVAAGASFESRHPHNAYSLVSLDVMGATRTVKVIQYKPTDGAFSYESQEAFPLIIGRVTQCGVDELGRAIECYQPALFRFAYYMAALLLEAQAEVPIFASGSYAFGSMDLLENQPDGELKAATIAFMRTRNPLRLLGGSITLADFLSQYGEAVERLGSILNNLSGANPGLRQRLDEREKDARVLAGAEPLKPFAHSLALLEELAAAQEWTLLREQADRQLTSADVVVATVAKRMLALALAQSDEGSDRRRAADLYQDLADGEMSIADDLAALASLLIGLGEHNPAKTVVLRGMHRFPEATNGFFTVGQIIVEATGDRAFRNELDARRAGERRE